ncbi:MAG: nucleotide pyrophosphohydrolase [Bacillota bacterium]|nr:nucleotide pyrophosphohydrolase [Bacillota bacterium]
MEKIIKEILKFRNDRDWKQFHTPENLSKSIAIESGELLEHFQWGDEYNKEEVKDELADILIYSILLSEALDEDIFEIVRSKLNKNMKRFPINKVKGNSGKYTRVDDPNVENI